MDLKHLCEKCKKHKYSKKHLNPNILGTVSKLYRWQGNKYNEKVGKNWEIL
jgi:predicted nucleic-acid-binding Zn-ribbon protein